MSKLFLVAALGVATLCALAGPAAAKTLPPSAAVLQYTEAVPGAGGDQTAPAGAVGAAGPAAPGAPKPSPKQRALTLANATPDQPTGSSAGGGMGIILPAILLASLLGAISLFVARRRQDAAAV